MMVFIVSIIFGVCWGTNTVGYLMVDFFPSHAFHTIEASNTIVLFNSAINPIIYVWSTSDLRKSSRQCFAAVGEE